MKVSLQNSEWIEGQMHKFMVWATALWHAVQPLLIGFVVTHQDTLSKGNFSSLTRENLANLVVMIVLVTWKTRGQRAASPIEDPAKENWTRRLPDPPSARAL